MTDIKICGITRYPDLQACLALPVRYIGLNFVPHSRRFINIADAARLSAHIPTGMRCVGVFADPDDAELDAMIPHLHLDMIQLHGSESPGRVAAIKARTGVQVMKAIPVATKEDMAQLPGFDAASDWLLFDAKNEQGKSGGLGQVFDWSILSDVSPNKPWMLAGGLTADNVAQALSALNPDAVDVAGGVESAPGEKGPCKIAQFVEAVRS